MDTTTVERNIAIVEAVLSGSDYTECAKKFNISAASIANSVRAILKLLKEHTDIDIVESASYAYIVEKKDEVKKYLAGSFPKTPLTPTARSYLQKKFGKYYAREPDKLVAEWEAISKAFNPFSAQRDLLSIQKWLASEGYLVGNILTDEMIDFAWNTLTESLSLVAAKKDQYSFVIKKVERTGWKTKLVIHAEMTQDDHQVTRRFAIDLIPS
jgi:hypothetical protein